jgi:hypothetical protein
MDKYLFDTPGHIQFRRGMPTEEEMWCAMHEKEQEPLAEEYRGIELDGVARLVDWVMEAGTDGWNGKRNGKGAAERRKVVAMRTLAVLHAFGFSDTQQAWARNLGISKALASHTVQMVAKVYPVIREMAKRQAGAKARERMAESHKGGYEKTES